MVDMGIPGGTVGAGISPWLTRAHARYVAAANRRAGITLR